MNELQITARLKIHHGRLDDFKTVAQACMDSVREKDSDSYVDSVRSTVLVLQ